MTGLRIGTRGSVLALWQARTVAAAVTAARGVACEIVTITTRGDRDHDADLSAIGGKRVFVKEIEDALMAGAVDVAVHSAKDLPGELPERLLIAAVLPREDPRDVLVLPAGRQADECDRLLETFDGSTRIGTGSVRRIAQLRRRLVSTPTFCSIRGNLDTRLRKLDEGQVDVLVLAAAGLQRLGLAHRISARIPLEACVPAPGQGTIAVEVRRDDQAARDHVAPISDAASAARLAAERSLVLGLGGGCQLPVGAIAEVRGTRLDMSAIVISLDGSEAITGTVDGEMSDAEALGADLATQLLASGAGRVLEQARLTTAAPPATRF